MVLGRIIRSVRKAFVMGDDLSFMVQGGAAGLIVTGNNASLGSKIVVVGIVIQLVTFCFFIATSAVFQIHMHRLPTREAFDDNIKWKRHLHVLYASSLLILIRSIFRIFEYAQGIDGYSLTHEWTLYIFDTILMFAVVVVWGIWHPGNLKKFLVSDRVSMSLERMG
jgi:hypothetical protein